MSIVKKYFSDFVLTSVEADKDWANKVQQLIAGVKDKNHGNFNLLNIEYDAQANIFKGDVIATQITGDIDLIFIDAPPDTLGENIRLCMCQELYPLLGKKSTLVLHDTNRTDERFAYSVMTKKFRMSEIYDTAKGIAILRYPKRFFSVQPLE